MRVEYEFYFKGGDESESSKDFAWRAMLAYVQGNTSLKNIGKVEIISLNDYEWADDGAFCCFEIEGEQKDLEYLIFKNAEILDDILEQKVHWETCVEKII
tara:strand:+ start:262 stop:561 length:300 start_codon:yes stop_codon:yes gene_type:complete